MTALTGLALPRNTALKAKSIAPRGLLQTSVTHSAPALPRANAAKSAQFLSETIEGLDEGAHFLDRLSANDLTAVKETGRKINIKCGEMVFTQGESHEGIFIIESGVVRVYYSAPSAREVTLAYWTPGHFIGGPELYGKGTHIWSGEALEDTCVTVLSSNALQMLIAKIPNFALALSPKSRPMVMDNENEARAIGANTLLACAIFSM